MAEDKILESLEYLVHAYGGMPAVDMKHTIGIYREALGGINPEILRRTVEKAVQTCKFFPRIAELIEIRDRICKENGDSFGDTFAVANIIQRDFQDLKDRLYSGDPDIHETDFETLARRYDAIGFEFMASMVRDYPGKRIEILTCGVPGA